VSKESRAPEGTNFRYFRSSLLGWLSLEYLTWHYFLGRKGHDEIHGLGTFDLCEIG